MLFEEALNSYTTYLQGKRSSQNTIESYTTALRMFHNYCTEYFESNEIDITQININTIRQYLSTLMDSGVTTRTVLHRVTALKMFFKYLFIIDIIAENPMKKIKTPKYQRKLPHFFSEKEIDKFCELPDTQTFQGMRDRAIIELFYSSGLRVSELVNLTTKDIDLYNKCVTVVGKGDKKRIVPMTDASIDWLKKYSKIRDATKTDIFFLSNRNEPLSRGNVLCIIKKYAKSLGLSNGYSPHTLRHTFATHLLREGANLTAIKDMLGHTSIATTAIYTHITPSDIRNELLRGHPRSEKKLEKP